MGLAPVASNRLAGIELWSTTNLTLGLTQWNRITNPLVLGNGVVRATNLNAGGDGKFFMVYENPIPPP